MRKENESSDEWARTSKHEKKWNHISVVHAFLMYDIIVLNTSLFWL
jgi:hypothetical protein